MHAIRIVQDQTDREGNQDFKFTFEAPYGDAKKVAPLACDAQVRRAFLDPLAFNCSPDVPYSISFDRLRFTRASLKYRRIMEVWVLNASSWTFVRPALLPQPGPGVAVYTTWPFMPTAFLARLHRQVRGTLSEAHLHLDKREAPHRSSGT
jgi:hypothetical protein